MGCYCPVQSAQMNVLIGLMHQQKQNLPHCQKQTSHHQHWQLCFDWLLLWILKVAEVKLAGKGHCCQMHSSLCLLLPSQSLEGQLDPQTDAAELPMQLRQKLLMQLVLVLPAVTVLGAHLH